MFTHCLRHALSTRLGLSIQSTLSILPTQTRKLCSSNYKTTVDYYKILDVHKDATQDDIKTAYYKLSKIYHPDMVGLGADDAQFARINEAYEILGNIDKRRQYDNKSVSFSHLQRRPPTSPRSPSRRPYKIHPYYSQNYSDNMYHGPYQPPRATRHTFTAYDELYRHQYAEMLRRYQMRNDMQRIYERKRQEMEESDTELEKILSIIPVFIVGVAFIVMCMELLTDKFSTDKSVERTKNDKKR